MTIRKSVDDGVTGNFVLDRADCVVHGVCHVQLLDAGGVVGSCVELSDESGDANGKCTLPIIATRRIVGETHKSDHFFDESEIVGGNWASCSW